MAGVSAPIRVLIVDDDPLVRSGLSLILGGLRELSVVGQAGDGRAGLAAVAEHRPDVVLMDIRMPVMDGIAATRAIRDQPDPPRVIALTTFGEDDYVMQTLGAGAIGFLLKDTSPEELVDAIRRVARGEPVLSPAATNALIGQVASAKACDAGCAANARARLDELTDREREVAVAVSRGLSNADIAAELHLSIPTVKAHIGRLFTKLDVDNRVQLAICVHGAELE